MDLTGKCGSCKHWWRGWRGTVLIVEGWGQCTGEPATLRLYHQSCVKHEPCATRWMMTIAEVPEVTDD